VKTAGRLRTAPAVGTKRTTLSALSRLAVEQALCARRAGLDATADAFMVAARMAADENILRLRQRAGR